MSQADAVRQNLVTVLDASDDAITTCSLDGVFVTWNRGAEKLYGYSAEEAIGQALDLIVPPAERDHEHGRWHRMLNDEPVKSLETTRTTKDGRTVVVAVTRSLILDADGGVVGVASVGRDITELKRAQALLAAAHAEAVEASKMKSQFMANMNHELRTPLNGVIGISRLLLETDLTDEQREYAEALSVSGEALLGVIGDILDFSKVEAGKLELVDEPLAVRPLVEGVRTMIALGAGNSDVRLTSLVGPELPESVWGDETRLRQVLTNLAGNAVKFTPRGKVAITVRRYLATDRTDHLRFEVADTGIGIAPEAQEAIFESFAQADGSTTRRYGGTGLGLAIARQLVTLMGGAIGVRSAIGEGSTFWFTVPLRPAEAAVVASEPPTAGRPARAAAARRDGPRRILVAEDNPINQIVTRRLLEQRGFVVDVADDGRKAVEMHLRAPYDLIFMDCQMPELDGFDATRAIRSLEGDERRTPVVALTASTMSGDTQRCFDAGMDRFAAKPIRPAELERLLDELLDEPLTSAP